MSVKVRVSSKIARSARVTQVESMFDVPPSKRAGREWDVDLPLDEAEWNVGLIVGPSGSGKTTIARHLFGERVIREYDWPAAKAVIDGFPAETPVKEVVLSLTAVGFSSPPSWLQPYSTLSTGEQFRANLARAIVETPGDDYAVIDEFTSTVDRQVAKVGSHAVQKAVRRAGKRMIALSCHTDIVDWLQPDWVYQTHTGAFTRRCLRRTRPPIELDIRKVDRSVWPLFRDHHYLTGDLQTSAQIFGAFVDDQIVAIGSYIHFPGTRIPAKKGHRFVCLPDWQGLGIITALGDWMGEYLWERGYEWRATLGHQGLIAAYLASPRWRLISAPSAKAQLTSLSSTGYRVSAARDQRLVTRNMKPRSLRTYSFAYVPIAGDAKRAERAAARALQPASDPASRESRRLAIKGARANARYAGSDDRKVLQRAKVKARRASRRRLLELDPSQTCVGIVELPDHACSEHPKECHHRDGNWRNLADGNLAWACRDAHEELDRRLGV